MPTRPVSQDPRPTNLEETALIPGVRTDGAVPAAEKNVGVEVPVLRRAMRPESVGTASNSAGTTLITPSRSHHTHYVTFTGGAGVRILPLAVAARLEGDLCTVQCEVPATSGILVEFRNDTDVGAHLLPANSFAANRWETDGFTTLALFTFQFVSGAWRYLTSKIPA